MRHGPTGGPPPAGGWKRETEQPKPSDHSGLTQANRPPRNPVRFRQACAVPDGTDFHSLRRNVITVLENAGVGQVPIARFVGRKARTMAGDAYSAGMAEKVAREVADKVRALLREGRGRAEDDDDNLLTTGRPQSK